MKAKGKLFIGTSGWCYKHWGQGTFYPEKMPQKKWLEFYSNHFTTVEINNTFYNTPKESVFAKWRDTVPGGFRFAVKVNKFITHNVKLKNPGVHLKRFYEPCSHLLEKLGPILFQFDKNFIIKAGRLKDVLEYTKSQNYIKEPKLVFEFRNKECLSDEIIGILKEKNAAICFTDYMHCDITTPETAGFIYIRRHGPEDTYTSLYTREQLGEDATRIKSCLENGKDVYAYYNNDACGFAVQNARELCGMMGMLPNTI
jgi:uncharacterized protein YecE (DUF72 family)